MKSEEPRGMGANPMALPTMPPSPRMSPRMRRVRPSSQERQQRREVRRALGELQEVRRAPIDCLEIRRSPIDRQEMRQNAERQQLYEARRSPVIPESQDPNTIPRDRSTSGDRQELRRTSAERLEIKEYLDKLRHLVPACPKAGKLSRLTVIQHVIDYIVELQDTLVHHPVNGIDSLVQGMTDPIAAIMSQQLMSQAAIGAGAALPVTPPSESSNTTSIPVEGVLHDVTVPTRGIKDNTNPPPSVRAKTTSTSNTSSSSSNKSSKKSSCRRPLGVLSSLKNNRMH